MLRNYIVTAVRNLLKHRLYSAINIAGLAVGLAACILIALFVRDEFSYERFWPKLDRMHRVALTFYIPAREPMMVGDSQFVMGPLLKEDFPGIEEVVRFAPQRTLVDRADNPALEVLTYADPGVFRVFGYEFLRGTADGALDRPGTVVLTQRMARKWFGDEDPVGQSLKVDGQHLLEVTGVVKDLPHNTHLKSVDFLVAMESKSNRLNKEARESWTTMQGSTYVLLRDGASAAEVQAGLKDFVARRAGNIALPGGAVAATSIFKYDLQPVADIHLHSAGFQGEEDPGDFGMVMAFAGIAVLILGIACINFMNLATARASGRAREVSIRKVVGAQRRQIVAQFLGESVVVTLLALVIAVALVELALPWFSGFVNKPLGIDYAGSLGDVAMLVALTVLVGVAAGSYPAFVLSAFKPAAVLKANKSSAGGGRLRAVLVVVQFAISISLMVATAVVYAQMEYAKSMRLGYDREHVLAISGTHRGAARAAIDSLREEIGKLPGVVTVARAGGYPTDGNENNNIVQMPDSDPSNPLVIGNQSADANFFKALGIQTVAGRTFDESFATDVLPEDPAEAAKRPSALVLNRAAVKRLGFASPEAAIGQTFKIGVSADGLSPVTVVGVVDDVLQGSIRAAVKPMMYYMADPYPFLVVRLSGQELNATVNRIDETWKRLVPGTPIRRTFLEDSFNALYAAEERQGQMFATFSGLAIVIACLGLFGLASFTAEKRTKEIGIRKVLGASVPEIVRLLVWQFSRPVLVANLIAWPLAWYAMRDWLDGFAYRVELSPLYFAVAGIAALTIAWATVASHATRVAMTKPSSALRYE